MFNEAQLSAINHYEGPMMVLAGPGSGKTTVITHRVDNLVKNFGVDERKILVITFTVAAATEMRDRYQKNVKGAMSLASFGTFHSIFFSILRKELRLNASNIIKSDYKYHMFKEFLVEFEIEYDDEKDMILGLYNEISRVKEDMLDVRNYYPISCPKDKFEKIFISYNERLKNERLIDFDDMQVLVYELFTKRQEILSRWQSTFEQVLIDEFQDINLIQYSIIKLLVNKHKNIFIVGDDDQSIYQFRGAKPEIMLGFNKDFEGTQIINLSINYRSSKEIVRVSQKLIGYNQKRFAKQMYTENEAGEAVDLRCFEDEFDELNFLVEKIKSRHRQGVALEDMAVLVRTNIQPRLLMYKLMEYNIDFQVKDRIPNIYEHWIAKDLIAYIRLACGTGGRNEFLRIMNKPVRYIARAAVTFSKLDFFELRKYYRSKPWMMGRISDLQGDLAMLAKLKPDQGIDFVKEVIEYDKYIKEHSNTHNIPYEELDLILDEIKSLSKDYDNYSDWFEGISSYEEELQTKMRAKPEDRSGINIITMHSAKGLEYDSVFIIDAVEGVTPHHKATKVYEIEEERRLFYVAMTRAIKKLHIFYTKDRLGKSQTPSRFVRELIEKNSTKK